ncbi:hypothetical protein [Qipengyuania sp. RANM35]|uniref:hypothetical protein n=1 Tax=Qipengyuania sp. RANM35 TaxID=3068635 RepID=UPI0034DAF240
MIPTNDKAIERIALGLIDTSLPKADWTHAAHFAAALWILRHRPDLAPPEEFKRLIWRYNEATGTPNTDTSGYHHTITVASLRASRHVLESASGKTPLYVVLNRLLESAYGSRNWILAYWEEDTLFSVEARKGWVEPDRAHLPF